MRTSSVPATRLVLAGDVMTGRGVDQILPDPGPPGVREQVVKDAREYVYLAERENGPIPRPVAHQWPWGDALAAMDDWCPAVRVMNLETSVTRSDDAVPGKAVHYRMNPANLGCLARAEVDVWSLANNHVLDYGITGLEETLETMTGAGMRTAGAGRDLEEASAPAAVPTERGRVLVWAVAHGSSGTPDSWASGRTRPGVALLPDLSQATADALGAHVRRERRPGDLAMVSVHWGANWGYRVPGEQTRFAHKLVDAGVDLVHGHSSHHPRPVEVYRGRLLLFGCGDLVNDYEGIGGYERYRDDLRLLYFATLGADTGELTDLRMLPLRARRMRLELAGQPDVRWLAGVLDRVGRARGTHVERTGDGMLTLRW